MRPSRLSGATAATIRRIGVATALLLFVVAVQAVTISPVVVELSPSRRIVTITFTNQGDQPLRYQTQALAWSQVDGVDRREPSDELIVAPPIADIAPGGRQLFRVTLRRPPTGHEQAYRLIFEDVTATSVAAPATDEVAIRFRVNHDLPVFVAAAGKPQALLQLGPCLDKPVGTITCVRLSNQGKRYAQVKSLTLERGTWRKEMPLSERVLAGAWKQWELEVPGGTSGILRITAQSRDGQASIELPAVAR